MKTITINLDWPQEKVLEAITGQAAANIVGELEHEIRRDVRAKVSKAIEDQINAIVLDTLTREFQPVDEFGDPKGEPSTVKAIIATKARKYMNEQVGTDGRASNTYGTKQPRWEWIICQLVGQAIDRQVKEEIAILAKDAKAKAHLEVARLLVAQIQKG